MTDTGFREVSLRRGFRAGGCCVQPFADRVVRDGSELHVRPRVMDLLVFLASRSGQVVSREEVLDGVWSTRCVSESVLSSAVAEARQSLGDSPRQPRFIETIPKRGYRFLVAAAPLSVPGASSGPAVEPGPPWPEGPESVFVGREDEVALLEAALLDVRAGHGRVVFVSGEAGSGKTALLAGFAARVLATKPDVAVAGGKCPLPVGPVEPFLPFREALRVLAGDPEGGWLPGASKADTSARLASWRRELVEVAAECGTTLSAACDPAGIDGEPPDSPGPISRLESMFRAFSNRCPLVLLIDDLQWADAGSIALLFRLGRHLPRSRVLLLASFRPEEVQPTPGRHPLERTVDEIVRCGERNGFVHLGEGPDRAFVDALLDAVPNAFDRGFRDALFELSEGHPLITVEALRDLCAKGILAPNGEGLWAVVKPLGPLPLPERVEALVREQVETLDGLSRAVLVAASVEGQEFCVETVAAALGEPVDGVVERLASTLGRQRRLVAPSLPGSLSGRSVSRYRFRHAAVRRYVLERLDEAEERIARERAAAAALALRDRST